MAPRTLAEAGDELVPRLRVEDDLRAGALLLALLVLHRAGLTTLSREHTDGTLVPASFGSATRWQRVRRLVSSFIPLQAQHSP